MTEMKKLVVETTMYEAMGRTNAGESITNASMRRLNRFRKLTGQSGEWVGNTTVFMVADNFKIEKEDEMHVRFAV